jgi:hypothetical protein
MRASYDEYARKNIPLNLNYNRTSNHIEERNDEDFRKEVLFDFPKKLKKNT